LLVVDTDEGYDGRAPAFDAELGVGLDPISFLGQGIGQNLGGDDCPLAAAPMESDFDHESSFPEYGRVFLPRRRNGGKKERIV
jgi:hypothetical protein